MKTPFLKIFIKNFSNFLYPSYCRTCSVLIEQNEIFCFACKSKIKPIVTTFLSITPKKYMSVFAISDYQDPIRPLILKKAFSDVLASKQIAQLILENILYKMDMDTEKLKIDYIVPIPLHWTRYAKRGFNQSYIISKVLSKNLNIKLLNILKRKKRTVFQSSLSWKDRQTNVKNIFDLKIKYKIFGTELLSGKNILLVDDLCTTGATLKNAAKFLNKFDTNLINAVVACRVI